MAKILFGFILLSIISTQNILGFWTDPQSLLKVLLDSATVVERDELALPHTNKVCITDLPTVRSANQAESIRNELLTALNRLPEVSGAFTSLIAKAADAISELMSDGNSTLLLDITGKTGRMFTETTASFAKLLQTTDRFLDSVTIGNGVHPAYDAELITSKLKLVDTTRATLSEFLTELANLSKISFEDNEKTKDILLAEELLIDKTKESYHIVYDTTNRILRQVLETDFASKPVKKIIAARVLRSATNNINAFANLRKNISQALAEAALKNGFDDNAVTEFQNHIKNELLATTWNDGTDIKEADSKLPLTQDEKKELEGLMVNYNKEYA